MATPSLSYTRLPGYGTEVASYSRLWAGPDHLLLVRSTGFSESYKRFYYRDIQAFVITQTVKGNVVNAVLGACTVPLVVWAVLVPDVTRWIALGSVGLLGLGLLVNVVLGPTCRCYLRTAVHRERLWPWGRLRTVHKGVERLRPLIERSQGTLSVEELARRLQGVGTAGAPAMAGGAPAVSTPPGTPPRLPPATRHDAGG